MEWETKVDLAEALNNGDNKKVCDIVLNNDMDIQAWDMFLCGMDLRKYEEYRPLLGKIKEERPKIEEHIKIRDFIRLITLIEKLERS